nr:hypothetical protein BaRGS_032863 [Batillaria attramentaria]
MIIPCKWHAIHAQRCGNYRIFVTPGNQIDEKGNQFMSTMFLGFADVATGQRWSGHLSVTTIQGFVDEVRDEPFHTLFKSVDYDVHDIVTWTSEEVGEYSGVTFTAITRTSRRKDAADKNTINQRKNELGLDSLAQTALFDALIFDKTAQPQYKDLQLFEGFKLLELGALLEDMLCRLLAGAATALCRGGQSELPVHVCIEAVVSGSEP